LKEKGEQKTCEIELIKQMVTICCHLH